jgi:SAM-dependent methyltransferase
MLWHPERSYADTWNDLARENAVSAVCWRMTEAQLDESGRIEAAWLWGLLHQCAAASGAASSWEACNLAVLDIGGGIGRIAKHLAPRVREYHLLDVSQEMLDRAAARCAAVTGEGGVRTGDLHFHLGNGYDLSPIDSDRIDFALSEMCFQHCDREVVVSYLLEVRRVLRRRGWAYLQVPPMEYPARLEEARRGDWPANFRRWHAGEFCEVAVRCGLSVLAANPEGGEYLLGKGVDVNWQRTTEEEGATDDSPPGLAQAQ